MKPYIIAISGGIGCGKSLVSKILTCFGYLVYDCDYNAKYLMNNDNVIKKQISDRIYSKAITSDGFIDRKILSDIVFNNAEKLEILNSIVHTSVKNDIIRWIDNHSCNKKLFIETAILYQSGLDKIVDEVWEVEASTETRIKRVIKRNGITEKDVKARIKSQEITRGQSQHNNIKTIINDGNSTPILPQIYNLINI